MQNKKTIHIISLGGTICMQQNAHSSGLDCSLDAASLSQSARLFNYHVCSQNLAALPSGSLEISHLLEVYKAAKAAVKAGAAGIIVTQGTDTLEESAFLLSLFWQENAPLVFTGAMRSADALGADGAANLFAAAAACDSAQAGVYVCANDLLIAPAYAHKSHSSCVQAFVPLFDAGCARFFEGKWRHLERAKCDDFGVASNGDFAVDALLQNTPRVAIYASALGDDGQYLRAICSGDFAADALIIDAFGSGHVAAKDVDTIEKIAARIPVIVASRCVDGGASFASYGYAGSEIDLQRRGCCMSGCLDARKARLAAMVLIACGMNVREYFCRLQTI